MKRIWDKITGRAALKKEIQQERSKSDILNFMLSADGSAVKDLERRLAEEKAKSNALLSAVDKARKERNEANRRYNELIKKGNISEEEILQLFDSDVDRRSVVTNREMKKYLQNHQRAVVEVFNSMELHAKTIKPLSVDDIQYYREYVRDIIGRRI